MEITIGLYYNGARYLAAWLGRWTSADPIGMQAGLNLYQYCRGSPINYVDPSGTEDEKASITGLGNFNIAGSPAAKGTTLSERLYVEPFFIRDNFDTAVREAHDPDASTAATIGLGVAAAALTPAAFLEEIVRAVANVPHSGARSAEAWHDAFTNEDPDEALASGLEGTTALVTGVLAPLEPILPASWFRPRSRGQGQGSTQKGSSQAESKPKSDDFDDIKIDMGKDPDLGLKPKFDPDQVWSRSAPDADFSVGPEGTSWPLSQERMRAGFDAAGFPSRPGTLTSEPGVIHEVPSPHGTIDVRTMEGSSHHPPRAVFTRPGTNDPTTLSGAAPAKGTPRGQRRDQGHLRQKK